MTGSLQLIAQNNLRQGFIFPQIPMSTHKVESELVHGIQTSRPLTYTFLSKQEQTAGLIA